MLAFRRINYMYYENVYFKNLIENIQRYNSYINEAMKALKEGCKEGNKLGNKEGCNSTSLNNLNLPLINYDQEIEKNRLKKIKPTNLVQSTCVQLNLMTDYSYAEDFFGFFLSSHVEISTSIYKQDRKFYEPDHKDKFGYLSIYFDFLELSKNTRNTITSSKLDKSIKKIINKYFKTLILHCNSKFAYINKKYKNRLLSETVTL
ncbi:hypothetical protein COBT_003838, partial [Conglomerata obtusa]